MTRTRDLEAGIAAGGDDNIHKPVSDVVLGAKIRAMQRIIQMRYSLLVLTAQARYRQPGTAPPDVALDGLTGIANRRHFRGNTEPRMAAFDAQGNGILGDRAMSTISGITRSSRLPGR